MTVLDIGKGIEPKQVLLHRSKTALIVEMRQTGEKITIDNWFKEMTTENNKYQIHFADGTTWSEEDVAGKLPVVSGTDGNDRLEGTD